MEMAIRYNHTASHLYGFGLPFTPCPFGLQGTHGARYGPLPVWIDQIFLVFTQQPGFYAGGPVAAVRIVNGRGARLAGENASAQSVVCRGDHALSVDLAFCPVIVGQHVVHPISALLLAAYARFLADSKPAALIAVVICCVTLPLVHLMGIAMVLPVLLHALLFRRARFGPGDGESAWLLLFASISSGLTCSIRSLTFSRSFLPMDRPCWDGSFRFWEDIF